MPDTWKVVTVEGTSKEWEGRSCVVEGDEVAIEVGRVQVETRVRGQVVGVAKKLEMGREGRVVPEVDSVVMRGWGVGDVGEIERDGVGMFIIKGV